MRSGAVERDDRIFVGRGRELEQFASAQAQACAGRGQLVLLAGEPGIGKTRLATECAARATAAGMRVLWGRAWEGEGAPAFWPWTQVVRAYLRDADPAALASDLGRAGAEIARVMPEVEALLPPESRIAAGGTLGLLPEQERFRFFDGLTLFLKAASRRAPLLVVLDDLQWADTPSLLLWQFVAQEVADSHLLLVGTYRDGEVDREHPLFQVLGAVRREPHCHHLGLAGLGTLEIGRYVEGLTGLPASAELVAALEERTEGNPFFLRELLQLMQADGTLATGADARRWRQAIPSGIRQVIGRRLARLPAECIRLLMLASAIGREFSLAVLGAVASAPGAAPAAERETSAALRPAVGIGLLQETTLDSFAFTHAMIRETLYADLAPADRSLLHRRIGERLETGAAGDVPLSELAHHFAAAGRSPEIEEKALSYTWRAGDRALRALAYEDAAALYRRARAMPGAEADRRVLCNILLALEEAEMRAGNTERARAASLEAAQIARALDDRELVARAALGSGWHFGAGVVDQARIDLLRDALDRLDPADRSLRARLAARLAAALYFVDGSHDWRATLSAEAVGVARRLSNPSTLAFTLNARLYALWGPDDTELRLQLGDELLRLAEASGDCELELQSRHWLIMDLAETGRIEEARGHIAKHAALALRQRQPLYLWFAEKFRASLSLLEGQVHAAEAHILRAFELGRQAEPTNAETTAVTQQFILGLAQGGMEVTADVAAGWALQGAFEAAQACGRALLFAETGRVEALRRELDYLVRLGMEKIPRDAGWLAALTAVGVGVSAAGDLRLASSVYEQLRPFAARVALAGMLDGVFWSVSHSLGLLATTLGRLDEAERHFGDALAMHERLRARPLIARTQHAWAALLLRRDAAGDVERARSLLDAALATARDLGLKSLEGMTAALRDSAGRPTIESDARVETKKSNAFCRAGDMWTIRFAGQTVQLRDTRGLQYLAQLLGQPARELHATALIGSPTDGSDPARAMDDSAVIAADLGDAGAILDGEATAQYQRRLADLREELAEAEAHNDLGRLAGLREELEFLSDQLASAGRGRRAASHAERARVTVAKGIAAAVKKIAAAHPELGRHLKATIRTGYFCSYTPDPRLRIEWLV